MRHTPRSRPRGPGRTTLALLSACLLALVAGGCGASDEERVRESVGDLNRALDEKDGERACGLLSPYAEAQYTAILGLFGGERRCAKLVADLERDADDRVSKGELERAKVRIRGDLALVSGKGMDAIGLRRIDGEWQVDNILNPSLRARTHGDPRLSRGTDVQQIRATVRTVSRAFAEEDYGRVCGLLSPGAEAQMLMAAAFASLGQATAETAPSCAQAWRAVSAASDEAGVLGSRVPSDDEIAAAPITIRGNRATVKPAGTPPQELVRFDGRWLIGASADERPKPVDLKRCWRAAGAVIAAGARDLRFAEGTRVRSIAIGGARVSIKGDDWRIFYVLPDDGDDPGLSAILEDPGAVAAVAYVKEASKHAAIVRRARACGED